MSRWYRITFTNGLESETVVTSGNTRRSAERSARAFTLKKKLGEEQRRWWVQSINPTPPPADRGGPS